MEGEDNRTPTKEPRVAAVDYGRARIGIAVADELGLLAHPRPFVPARPPPRAVRQLKALFRDERITLCLVGLPRNMDGTEGLSARRARAFGRDLESGTGVPVEFVDERLSTLQAQARLHEAGKTEKGSRTTIDSASAAVLLQAWLDTRPRKEAP